MISDNGQPPSGHAVHWKAVVWQRAADAAARRVEGVRSGTDSLRFVRLELNDIATSGQRIDPPQAGPPRVEEPENGGSYAGFVLATVMVAGGIWIGLSLTWLFGVIALVAAAYFCFLSAALFTTQGQARRAATERAQQQLENAVQDRARQASNVAYEAAAEVFCRAMGVPERFRSEVETLVRSGGDDTFVLTLEELASRPRYGEAPIPTALRVEPAAYEDFCAVWMRHKGASGVRVTQRSRDGGIDIASDYFVAQCKRYAGAVAVKEIRDLFGAATVNRKQAVFFTTGRYTAPGISFAEQAGVALFVLTTGSGKEVAVSSSARALSTNGLNPDEW